MLDSSKSQLTSKMDPPPLKWNIKCLQKELNLIFLKLRHPNLSLTVDFIVFIAVASIAACSDKRLSWEQELLLGPSASVLSAAFTDRKSVV